MLRLPSTLLTLVLLSGCWEMLPASRDPTLDAQHRERDLCGATAAPTYPPQLFSPASVTSVEPLYFARSERGSQEEHLLGAKLGFVPPPSTSSEELERLLNCHAVRAQLRRPGELEMADDPFALPGHLIHIHVRFDEGATHVEIEAKDVAGAEEILRRSRAFQGQFDEAAALAAFHAQRLERLRAPDGWLTLVGLVWLHEGDNLVGAEDALRLPAGWPAHLGTFTRRGGQVSFSPARGVAVTRQGHAWAGGEIAVAADDESDPILIGELRLTLIRRGDRLGLRLRDPASPLRANLKDVPTYPARGAWRVVARFEPAAPGQTLRIQNVLGQVQPMPSPGSAVFEIGGASYRLSPVIDDPGHLFFVFGDLTNRDATYGAGRFLTSELPKDGQVVLDFNQAVNPPCAFTAFATCPLPPRENRLPIRVEAGELRAGNHAADEGG